jgi:hypothetical protein
MVPVFDFIPILQDTGLAHIRVIVITGFSTRIGAESSPTGKLYGKITPFGGEFLLEVFTDHTFASDSLVMSGTAEATDEYFSLGEQNNSGLTGRAVIGAGALNVSQSVIIVTFAVDSSVNSDPTSISRFPGYDSEYGLATFHARAMRTILADYLPQAIPHLFVGKQISAFAPLQSALALPSIDLIRNPNVLERLQADEVKDLSASEREYLEEWGDLATAARARESAAIKAIIDSNPAPTIDTTTIPLNNGVLVDFSSFTRA